MSNVRKLFFFISALITGCIFGVVGLFISRYGWETVLSVRPFVILSGSMEPAIPVGSLVLVIPEAWYLPGDIITFRSDPASREMVTHRIVTADPGQTFFTQGQFTTKGDANKTADYGVVPASNVVGRVFSIIPSAGYAVNFSKTPQGFILLVIIPATIIIWEELKSTQNELARFFRRSHKDKPENQHQEFSLSGNSNFLTWTVVGSVVLVAGVTAVSTSVRSFLFDRETSRGNVFGAASVFVTPTPAIAQYLVINEVLPDSACSQGGTEAQWLEVYNGYPYLVNLKNFQITDGTNLIDLVTAASVEVPSGGFALLAHSASIWGKNKCFDNHGVTTANLGGTLNIDTGKLQLLDKNDVVIDTVIWGTGPLTLAQNQSIEREPDGLDSGSGSYFNTGDFVVRDTPMAGQ
jgi:signal peptidase